MLFSTLLKSVPVKPTGTLTGIAYGAGLWVIVGFGGAIWTSTDARKWTSRTSGTTNDIADVNYTGSLFFACGAAGLILTSTDGITWTDRSVAISDGLQRCSVANNTYFITGGSGSTARLYTSTNGTTWTGQTVPTAMRRTLLDVIYYDNGTTQRYYVVGTQSGTQPAYGYSTNLTTWTSDQSGMVTGGNGFSLTTNGSIVVLGANNASSIPNIASSTNGTSYTSRFVGSAATGLLRKAIWTGTSFIIVSLGGNVYTSSNGTSWTETNITTENIRGIRQQGNEILIVGDNGLVGRSIDDGATWSFL